MIHFLKLKIASQLKNWLMILILIGFSLFALKALYHPGFYTSHDGWHQIARLYHFDQALRDGQFPPRWGGLLLHGFGYPLFIFSYHMPWWIAEPFVILGVSIFTSIKIVFLLTYILSGILMFIWIDDMWGRRAGFIAALVYLFTPYRFANILVRANIGEAVCFTFLPLIFISLFRLHKRYSFKAVILGALGIAGSLLSHVMVLGILFLLLTTTFAYFLSKTKNKLAYFLSVFGSIILGLGLASYYIIPAYFYKPMTVLNEIFHLLYKNQFTSLGKLLYSPWGYGAIGEAGEMSRQIGLVIWLLLGLSLANIVFNFLKKDTKTLKYQGLIYIVVINFIFAILMMLEVSKPVWKMMESLALIDFPWRFLAVTTLLGSITAGFIVAKTQNKFWKNIIFTFIIIAVLYTNRNHLNVNQYTDIPLSLYIDSELTTNSNNEYLPKWVNSNESKRYQDLVQGISVTNLRKNTNTLSWQTTNDQTTTAYIHQMFFPGWQAAIDRKITPVSKADSGGISLVVPSGDHDIQLKYIPTIPMRLGEIISFISIILLSYGLVKSYKSAIKV